MIADGNVWAHEGNASRDTELYHSVGGRTDLAVYEILYGLHPGVVKTLSKSMFKSKEHCYQISIVARFPFAKISVEVVVLGDYRQSALDFYSPVLHSPTESIPPKSQLTCTKLSNIHPTLENVS